MMQLKSLKPVIYLAHGNNCWHFNIYKQDKVHAQIKRKKFYNPRARQKITHTQMIDDVSQCQCVNDPKILDGWSEHMV